MKILNNKYQIYSINIPDFIQEEISDFVEYSTDLKNHPYGYLKAHENAGYLAMDGIKHNSYQCSVPLQKVHDSFWLAWTIREINKIWNNEGDSYSFRLRNQSGHFGQCDLWTNFSYKGDDNPIHNHSGFVSGVIYYKNHGHPTIFPDCDLEHKGENGTMVVFPSTTPHFVKKQETEEERITLAFNFDKVF